MLPPIKKPEEQKTSLNSLSSKKQSENSTSQLNPRQFVSGFNSTSSISSLKRNSTSLPLIQEQESKKNTPPLVPNTELLDTLGGILKELTKQTDQLEEQSKELKTLPKAEKSKSLTTLIKELARDYSKQVLSDAYKSTKGKLSSVIDKSTPAWLSKTVSAIGKTTESLVSSVTAGKEGLKTKVINLRSKLIRPEETPELEGSEVDKENLKNIEGETSHISSEALKAVSSKSEYEQAASEEDKSNSTNRTLENLNDWILYDYKDSETKTHDLLSSIDNKLDSFIKGFKSEEKITKTPLLNSSQTKEGGGIDIDLGGLGKWGKLLSSAGPALKALSRFGGQALLVAGAGYAGWMIGSKIYEENAVWIQDQLEKFTKFLGLDAESKRKEEEEKRLKEEKERLEKSQKLAKLDIDITRKTADPSSRGLLDTSAAEDKRTKFFTENPNSSGAERDLYDVEMQIQDRKDNPERKGVPWLQRKAEPSLEDLEKRREEHRKVVQEKNPKSPFLNIPEFTQPKATQEQKAQFVSSYSGEPLAGRLPLPGAVETQEPIPGLEGILPTVQTTIPSGIDVSKSVPEKQSGLTTAPKKLGHSSGESGVTPPQNLKIASVDPSIFKTIENASNKHGIDPEYMRTQAFIESSFKPEAVANPKDPRSAAGLYQFVPSTAREMDLKDRLNPEQSADAAARYAVQNAKALKQRGMETSGYNLYMAHQQGAGGFSYLTKKAENNETDVSPEMRSAMDRNGGTGMTPKQFLEHQKKQYLSKEAEAKSIYEKSVGISPSTASPASGLGQPVSKQNMGGGGSTPFSSGVGEPTVLQPISTPSSGLVQPSPPTDTKQIGNKYGISDQLYAGYSKTVEQWNAEHPDKPLTINSGFRSKDYNDKLRARWDAGDRAGLKFRPAENSKHTQGSAIDIGSKGANLSMDDYSQINKMMNENTEGGVRWGVMKDGVRKDEVHFQLNKANEVVDPYKGNYTRTVDSKEGMVKSNAPTFLPSGEMGKAPSLLQQSKPTSPGLGQQQSKSVSNKKSEFVQKYYPAAEKAAAKLGVSPYTLLAQSALESNWGANMAKDSNNMFGIKANKGWKGNVVGASTLEQNPDGSWRRENAGWRAYNSPEESFKDYSKFIQDNPRYSSAVQSAKQGDDAGYLRAMHKAGYATDQQYVSKIEKIKNNLPSYDNKIQSPEGFGSLPHQPLETPPSSYDVQMGPQPTSYGDLKGRPALSYDIPNKNQTTLTPEGFGSLPHQSLETPSSYDIQMGKPFDPLFGIDSIGKSSPFTSSPPPGFGGLPHLSLDPSGGMAVGFNDAQSSITPSGLGSSPSYNPFSPPNTSSPVSSLKPGKSSAFGIPNPRTQGLNQQVSTQRQNKAKDRASSSAGSSPIVIGGGGGGGSGGGGVTTGETVPTNIKPTPGDCALSRMADQYFYTHFI